MDISKKCRKQRDDIETLLQMSPGLRKFKAGFHTYRWPLYRWPLIGQVSTIADDLTVEHHFETHT